MWKIRIVRDIRTGASQRSAGGKSVSAACRRADPSEKTGGIARRLKRGGVISGDTRRPASVYSDASIVTGTRTARSRQFGASSEQSGPHRNLNRRLGHAVRLASCERLRVEFSPSSDCQAGQLIQASESGVSMLHRPRKYPGKVESISRDRRWQYHGVGRHRLINESATPLYMWKLQNRDRDANANH
ncbi:hypothetical protein TNCV_1552541 [Trichonephila clavipes]|nr:hypothetical protein TNCV_1552541 [Trichonephila clavipes]